MEIKAFIIMGVSGCGKSTIARLLAEKLDWDFYDADDFHPADNIAKMAAGIPLGDNDRVPWLAALNEMLDAHSTGKDLKWPLFTLYSLAQQ